jgi:hypothetical protein
MKTGIGNLAGGGGGQSEHDDVVIVRSPLLLLHLSPLPHCCCRYRHLCRLCVFVVIVVIVVVAVWPLLCHRPCLIAVLGGQAE